MNSNANLLYVQVKQQIQEMIATMKPGQRLPSRNKLIEKFGVTRTTIDRAISELVGEGVLYTRDGSGTYKSDHPASEKPGAGSTITSWGVILPNIMHDTYPGILRGVEDVANQYGVNVVICNTDNLVKKQNVYIYKLLESHVSGIIMVPAIIGQDHDFRVFQELRENRIPFIFCNRGVDGVDAPRVISNNFYGAFLSTAHLLKQGYTHVGYISRPTYSTSLERYQGYISALLQAGADINKDRVVFEPMFDVPDAGYDSTFELLERCPETDALFCFNDELAVGAYRAVEEKHRKIGQDVGIVGYDNTGVCETLPVKLSSVRFKTYETGRAAAEILQKAEQSAAYGTNETVILQPELIVRDSSRRK